MRPFLTHALASEKPCPRRITATDRPDASTFPFPVLPPLPSSGLHSLHGRKVKVGKGLEKRRGKHSLNAYPLPINHYELRRKGQDDADDRIEEDSNIASLFLCHWNSVDPHTLFYVTFGRPGRKQPGERRVTIKTQPLWIRAPPHLLISRHPEGIAPSTQRRQQGTTLTTPATTQ